MRGTLRDSESVKVALTELGKVPEVRPEERRRLAAAIASGAAAAVSWWVVRLLRDIAKRASPQRTGPLS
ncbi:hypothetical protein GCM10009565_56740 [Amycolatopsis albidoflavus]